MIPKPSPLTIFRAALAFTFVLLSAFPLPALAQINSEIASCAELRDDATQTQTEICSAHVGCRMVLAVHTTCVKAKQFIQNLKEKIGEGVDGWFGKRKEVTPDTMFEASVTPKGRLLDSLPESKDRIEKIRENIKATPAESEPAFKGKTASGAELLYYGKLKDGLPEGFGTAILSNGEIRRGSFVAGSLTGDADVLTADRARFAAEYRGGALEGSGAASTEAGDIITGRWRANALGEGKWVRPDGSRFEGAFSGARNARLEGKEYDRDGMLREEGRFADGALSVGRRYDRDGRVTEVDRPREREQAEALARQADERRERGANAERQAAAQRRSDLEIQAAHAFRASLDSLNPGQLFARADELFSGGDKAAARQALRALIARFPDHALAEKAAQQMASELTQASAASRQATVSSASPIRSRQSVCVRNRSKLNDALTSAGNLMSGATGDGFIVKSVQLEMRILQPCISSDAEARSDYESLQSRLNEAAAICRNPPYPTACQQWGSAPAQNQRWFAFFESEANKALSDPAYSEEKGGRALQGAAMSKRDSCSQSEHELEAELSRKIAAIPQNDNVRKLATVRSVTLQLSQIWLACDASKAQAYAKTASDVLNTCRGIAANSAMCER